jgi:hypothetical protein
MKVARSLFLVGLAATSSVLFNASAANAASCTDYSVVASDSSGKFVGQKCVSGNTIYVKGTVYDLEADGLCVSIVVTYRYNNYTDYSPRACPKGDTDTFSTPTREGTTATIQLRLS